ncbi:hypothetical protein [[Eubacterium] cellulosolvens]
MVNQGIGSIFKRKDEKYFIYLPIDLVKDTAFPFPVTKSIKVKINFIPGKKELLIEDL